MIKPEGSFEPDRPTQRTLQTATIMSIRLGIIATAPTTPYNIRVPASNRGNSCSKCIQKGEALKAAEIDGICDVEEEDAL